MLCHFVNFCVHADHCGLNRGRAVCSKFVCSKRVFCHFSISSKRFPRKDFLEKYLLENGKLEMLENCGQNRLSIPGTKYITFSYNRSLYSSFYLSSFSHSSILFEEYSKNIYSNWKKRNFPGLNFTQIGQIHIFL